MPRTWWDVLDLRSTVLTTLQTLDTTIVEVRQFHEKIVMANEEVYASIDAP